MPEEAIQEVKIVKQSLTLSPEIDKLAISLAKARAKFERVIKDASNPFFKSKYADLSNIIEATALPLAENGLSIIQGPGKIADGRVELTTIMLHSSGQWIRCESEMLVAKQDAQGIGSAITYGRRYAEQSILNVAGEDDDGNAASSKGKPSVTESNDQYDQRTEDQKVVMQAQAQALHEAMKRTGKSEALVSGYLKEKGYKQFEQVLRSDFQTVLKWLNTAQKASGADLTPDLEKSVREAINKRLWALAAEKGIPEGDIKTYAYEKFKVDSMTRLGPEQLKDVVDWVKLL